MTVLKGLKALISLCAAVLCLVGQAAEVVLTQVAPLNDENPTSRHLSLGLRIYFEAVNNSGGIHGAAVRFVTKDRSLDASEAGRQTKQFVEESQPVMMVGLMGTGWMEEVVKSRILNETAMPVVGIRTGSVSLHEPVHPYLFHTRASYRGEIQTVLRQLATMGLSRISVFYEESAFGREGVSLVQKELLTIPSLALVGKSSYPVNTTNVTDALTEIGKAQPQCVIAIATSAATAEFYKTLRESGGTAQVIALSVADGAEVVKRIGKQSARGLILTHVVPDPTNRAIPIVGELHQNMKRYGPPGAPINHAVVEGYIIAKTAAAALTKAGPKPTRARVRAALDSLSNYDLGGVIIDFSPTNHTGSKHVEMGIVLSSGKMMR
ncbi:ABC transporter substrate-binding protein [Herbaspirillum sp. GCM10030257]|uniref:ABC transporter substrate-binding protein n=1 Tax=Herbaspirillum sp. GCM10030257 TaxID=3273393 RepID=UPI003617BAD4